MEVKQRKEISEMRRTVQTGGQDMGYEFSELALQNDWGNYTVDDYLRSFAIRPYGEDISYKTEAVQDTKQEPAPGKFDNQKTEPEQAISGLNNGQNYATLTKEQLMAVCIDKDAIIESCVKSLKAQCPKMLGKKEIMDVYHCESDKALRILKLMFQMGYGNKIGKEYYVSQKAQEDFLKKMVGKEVYI